MDEKELKFEAMNNSVDILYDDNDIAIVSLDLLHQDDTQKDHNNNMCNISHEVIEKAINTFKNKPIIYRLTYDNENLDDHSYNKIDDREYRIAGIIPADSRFSFIKRDNGKTYLNCEAILHKAYCIQLMEILKKNNGKLKVSIEIIAKATKDEITGVSIITSFVMRGCLILPPEIREGIENSNIEVLKFSDLDMSNFNKAYLRFSKQDTNIFEKIKNSNVVGEENKMKKIIINKSKDAMSNTPWGEIDKTNLRNEIIGASNATELVHFIYMKVEKDWKDAPSEKLGYPIGEIKGNEAVYNRGGLSSALGYAKAENNEEIVKKITAIYKELKLEKEEDMKDETKKIDNKLDEENKEISKIKDDAESIEDNKKEILKENAIDLKADKKLKDDVDSDKDYWKKKFSDVEAKFNTCNSELEKYKRQEEKEEMKNSLKFYKKCFSSEEEIEEFAKNIEIDTKEDFECKLTNKMKEFVKNMSEKDDSEDEIEDNKSKEVEKEFKNSFKPSYDNFNISSFGNKPKSIKELAEL